MKTQILIALMLMAVALTSFSQVKEVPFTQEDRDRLIRIEVQLNLVKDEMSANFDKIDKTLSGLISENKSLHSAIISGFDLILLEIIIANLLVIMTICYLVWSRYAFSRKIKIETQRMDEYIRKLET